MLKSTFACAVRAFIFSGLFTGFIWSAWEYEGCSPLEPEHFHQEILMSFVEDQLWEPIKLDFVVDDNGNVDIYFIEVRNAAKDTGSVKFYDAETDQVTTLSRFYVWRDFDLLPCGDKGLWGMALDPDFKSNHYMYLFYTMDLTLRVSRVPVEGDSLNWSKESYIINYFRNGAGCVNHTGGGMEFDAYGDLWIGFGDDGITHETGSNTADLRGGILRISPLPIPDGQRDSWGNGISYTVPKGNFGEYWTEKFTEQGLTDLAAEYADTNIVKPEIYAIGARQPFTMTLEPYKRWVTWGDCGPDGTRADTEEDNLITYPTNSGWPYFAGPNFFLSNSYGVRNDNVSPDEPYIVQRAGYEGATRVPPAAPSMNPYPQACAMTGPIYLYDPYLSSDIKMPPHFHNTWFVTEFNNQWVDAMKLNIDGTEILQREKLNQTLFQGMQFSKPTGFHLGPDGALYIINYAGYEFSNQATNIARIEYVGPQCSVDPADFPDYTGIVRDHKRSVKEIGPYTIRITDILGRERLVLEERGAVEYDASALLERAGIRGVGIIQVISGQDVTFKRMTAF